MFLDPVMRKKKNPLSLFFFSLHVELTDTQKISRKVRACIGQMKTVGSSRWRLQS